MTDDEYRVNRPQPHPEQPYPDWSGRQSDGTPVWGTPTHVHDPQHTEWAHRPTQSFGPAPMGPGPFAAAPPAPPQGSGARRSVAIAAAAALVAAAVTAAGFVATGHTGSSTVRGSGSLFPSTQGSGGSTANPGGSGGSTTVPTTPGSGSGSSAGNSPTSVAIANAKQQQGIVTIVSVLKYENAESAGTGMILDSNGEILTNNHVINGSTSITVTVESTGKSYRADVVGTDATDDVAVIKLRDASGLTKANVGDSNSVATGDPIIGVGNAGGTGTLRASSGKVTALGQTITASDGNGAAGERLHNLIQVNAKIISGDSGGPMYDGGGKIIGMNTAASKGQATQNQAYAIPIDNAVSIADQINNGVTTSTIKQGVPGFLGVRVGDAQTGGASITAVLPQGPADRVGIATGSVITSVDGKKTTSAAELKTVMSGVKPGSTVRITWTDANGASHSGNVSPIQGPAA